jgi:O-antigen ligase
MTSEEKNNIYSKVNTFLLSLVAVALLLPPNFSSISIIIYIAYVLFTSKIDSLKTNFKKNIWSILFLSSFYIINLLSYFYSENKSIALLDFQIKLSLLIFPILFLSVNRIDKNNLNKILIRFALAALFFTIILIIQGFLTQGRLLFNQELSLQLNIHASYLSLYLSFGFFTILNLCVKKLFKTWHSFLLIIYIIVIGILASRSVFVTTIVITIVWLMVSKDISKKLKIAFLSFVIICSVSLSFLDPIKSRFKEAIDFSNNVELNADPNEYKTLNKSFGGKAIRVAVWQCSVDIIKKDWLLGVGAGDTQDELQKAYKNHAFEFAWRYNSFNAHNLFLQSLISSGILGLFSVLSILAYIIFLSLKSKNNLFISFILLFTLLSFVESTFNVHKGVVFYSFFTGLFLNHFLNKDKSDLSN